MPTIPSTDDFISRLQNPDDAVRGPAWQGAATYGAAAVKPLANLMTSEAFETARAARRALWIIVRHAARPGATKEADAVTKELLSLLPVSPTLVRGDAVAMLSEIAGDNAVGSVAALLADPEVRESARCCLTRLPGRRATSALKTAFAAVPEDFKPALAESLRQRGETVKGYPSQKLVPSRATKVGAVQGAG